MGALYYVMYKSDFEMQLAYDLFQERKLQRLMKKHNFDDKKIQFLENYIDTLKGQIAILKNENDCESQ